MVGCGVFLSVPAHGKDEDESEPSPLPPPTGRHERESEEGRAVEVGGPHGEEAEVVEPSTAGKRGGLVVGGDNTTKRPSEVIAIPHDIREEGGVEVGAEEEEEER